MIRRRAGAVATVATLGFVVACGTDEQNYPDGDIEMIVPMSAGGSLDTTARAFAEVLEGELDENVQIVNRPGAAYTVGIQEAANTDADGYTLAMLPGSALTTVPLLIDTEFEAEDFVAVAPMIDRSYVLVTNTDSDYDSLDALASSEESYTYSTFGYGNFTHFAMANFAEQSGTDGSPVHFESTADIIQALANGQIDFAFIEPNFAMPYIEDGTMEALVTSAPERTEYLPDVPTFDELGYSDAGDITGRTILAAPADLPEETLEVLREAGYSAFESASYQDYYEESQGEPPLDPIDDFIETWAPEMRDRFESDLDRLNMDDE